MRKRKVITRRTARVVYKFPSVRQGRTIYCESSLEFNYAHLLEFDQNVLSYQEQPLTLTYFLEGKAHRYTADFQVDSRASRDLVEVKPTEDCASPENQRIFRAVKSAANKRGYGFVVADGDQIGRQPRLSNIKLLWKYARTPLHPEHQLLCVAVFAGTRKLTLGALFEAFRAKGYSRQVVYSLIWHGMLAVDLALSLIPSAAVTLPGPLSHKEGN